MKNFRTTLRLLVTSLIFSALGMNAWAAPKRSKVIDFESETVESLSKRPLNSVSVVNNDRNRKPSHLYRKRSGFSTETRETLAQSRYTP